VTDGEAPDATLAPPPPREGQARLWGRSLLYSLAGIGVLVAGEGVFLWFYHPPGREPLGTIALLFVTTALALLLGTLALAAGPRVGLGAIGRKMAFSVGLGALVAVGDVLLTARLMLVSTQDAYVMLMLLFFALLISLTLALSLADTLRRAIAVLMRAAQRMAAGHLDAPAPVESGDELGALAADMRRMAVSVAEAQQMQHDLEVARRDLVNGISHDLRTPLNALQTVASALADGVAAEEPATVAHYLRALDVQVDRLAALVDDLFTLARLQGPTPRLPLAPYPTADLLSDLLERAAPVAAEAGVRLEVTVASPTPAVLVDVRQIDRVLDNLVRNALQHTPPGGEITIQAAPRGERGAEVSITVIDTGEGIAPADLPLLFEMYYRGSGRPQVSGGAGLGLAIVKAVAQAHGGRVWAESPPSGRERGTLIGVVLPAATTAR